MKIPALSFFLLSSCLTGCYTQLATRGDYGRSQAAPAYGSNGSNRPDGPVSTASDSLSEDSALTASTGAADTLAPPVGAPTVIVNNYYDPYPHHRGYAHWEWDYPLFSFGYYSSHHGRYARPYWWDRWDDPWHSRRHI